MLDLRRLSILVTVAEEGSFTAAAERLYMTQSAVSQQMALLERDVGLDLFRRVARGVELTDAGQLLTSRARGLLTDSLAVEQELQRLARGGREVRLAAFVSAGVELLPQTFRAFMRRCPGSQLVVRDTSGEALSLLGNGVVDAVLMWDYDFEPLPPDHRFARIHLADDPMMAVLPPGHPRPARSGSGWLSWPLTSGSPGPTAPCTGLSPTRRGSGWPTSSRTSCSAPPTTGSCRAWSPPAPASAWRRGCRCPRSGPTSSSAR